MKLNSITIENYRCFKHLQIDFHPELTVLVANNAGGKSTCLDAIAIMLSDYVLGFPLKHVSFLGIDTSSRRRVVTDKTLLTTELSADPTSILMNAEADGNTVTDIQFRKQLPEVDAEMAKQNGDALAEARAFDKRTGKERAYPGSFAFLAEDYFQSIGEGQSLVLPLVAYYGAERLWRQADEKWHDASTKLNKTSTQQGNENFLSRIAAYEDCLSPGADYLSFVDWFQYIAKAHADQRNALIEKHAEKALTMVTDYGDLIEAIRTPVNNCLKSTGWGNIHYSHIHQTILMEHREFGVMELNHLSDGIRNMAAMVADMALRATRLNKHLRQQSALETPGIVLIDEIDLHLHPSWQQQILPVLRSTFPKVQFIVTTHSPQVLSSIPKECIRVLDKNVMGESVAAIPLSHSYGQPSNEILHAIMDVDPQPPIPEKADLERLTELVDQGLYQTDEVKTLLNSLHEKFNQGHPQLESVERSMRRQEALKALDNA